MYEVVGWWLFDVLVAFPTQTKVDRVRWWWFDVLVVVDIF